MTYTIHQATCPLICPVRAPVNECVWGFDFLLAKELLKTEDFLYIRQRPQHASFHTHSASVCNDLAILEANEIVLFFHVCVCVCVLCCCFLLKDHSKTFYFSISGAPPTFIKFLYRINEKKQSKNLKRKIQQNCPLSDGVTCFASPSPLIVSVHQTHTMLNCQSK